MPVKSAVAFPFAAEAVRVAQTAYLRSFEAGSSTAESLPFLRRAVKADRVYIRSPKRIVAEGLQAVRKTELAGY